MTDRTPGPVVTRTGIVIGIAYQRPAPRPGSEAERIQAALLAPDARRSTLSALAERIHQFAAGLCR